MYHPICTRLPCANRVIFSTAGACACHRSESAEQSSRAESEQRRRQLVSQGERACSLSGKSVSLMRTSPEAEWKEPSTPAPHACQPSSMPMWSSESSGDRRHEPSAVCQLCPVGKGEEGVQFRTAELEQAGLAAEGFRQRCDLALDDGLRDLQPEAVPAAAAPRPRAQPAAGGEA